MYVPIKIFPLYKFYVYRDVLLKPNEFFDTKYNDLEAKYIEHDFMRRPYILLKLFGKESKTVIQNLITCEKNQ